MQYEIRVLGRLGPTTLSGFEELEDFAVAVKPAETVMRGELRDQAELHGVLDRIRALGLELVEVRRTGPPDGTVGEA